MKFPLVFGAMAALASPVAAATINISDFSAGAYNSAIGSMTTAVVEDFETYNVGNVPNGFATSVGTFSTAGGVGTGGTVTKASFTNDGTLLAIREGDVYGRTSTTSALSGDQADNRFLDSNDTHGIRWDVSLGGQLFNKLLFTISDAGEYAPLMNIVTGGFTQTYSGEGNANQKLVEIDLGTQVSSASIFLFHSNGNNSIVNDGFSIDDVAVSAVPLPAASLLLLAGLGGLAAVGRRKS